MNTTPTTRPVRAGAPRRWNRATAAISAAIVAGTALAACSRPAPGQVAIDAVSVNQSVQSVDDRVPLITGKTTFVIVYLRAGGANIANIGGRLNVAGFNEVQPLTRRVTAVTTGYNPRGLDSALIFRLPAPMTVAGTGLALLVLQHPPRDHEQRAALPAVPRRHHPGRARYEHLREPHRLLTWPSGPVRSIRPDLATPTGG